MTPERTFDGHALYASACWQRDVADHFAVVGKDDKPLPTAKWPEVRVRTDLSQSLTLLNTDLWLENVKSDSDHDAKYHRTY